MEPSLELGEKARTPPETGGFESAEDSPVLPGRKGDSASGAGVIEDSPGCILIKVENAEDTSNDEVRNAELTIGTQTPVKVENEVKSRDVDNPCQNNPLGVKMSEPSKENHAAHDFKSHISSNADESSTNKLEQGLENTQLSVLGSDVETSHEESPRKGQRQRRSRNTTKTAGETKMTYFKEESLAHNSEELNEASEEHDHLLSNLEVSIEEDVPEDSHRRRRSRRRKTVQSYGEEHLAGKAKSGKRSEEFSDDEMRLMDAAKNVEEEFSGEETQCAPKAKKSKTTQICHFCDFAADNEDLLRQHLTRTHAPQRPMDCPHCAYRATDFEELKVHIAQEHTSDEPKLCGFCDYIAMDPEDLRKHKNDQHSKKYHCTECDYCSQYPSHVSNHIRSWHTKEKPFKCPHCDFRTVQASHLKPHINSKHLNFRPHKCDICGYATAQKGNLKSHILKKHTQNKPYKCQYCDYGSPYPGHLRNHVMVKHTNERPHKCTFCEYSAAQASQLKVHVLAKHTNLRPYVCRICNFGTSGPSKLNYHMRTRHPETKADDPSS